MNDKQVAINLSNIMQEVKKTVPSAKFVANECTDKNSKDYKKKFLGIMLPVSENTYKSLAKNQIELHMNGD